MKTKLRQALFLIFLLSSIKAFSQVPSIENVYPLTTFGNDTIVITGSGFSATAANLEVWFGSVKGTITTSSEFAIEVKVPAEAKLANVEVVNKATNLSTKSELKFIPSLKTEAFNTSKFVQAVSITSQPTGDPQNELWDLCVCDLNADGKPDIASTKFARPGSPYTSATDIMLLQNQSTPGNLIFTKIDRDNLTALDLGFHTDNVVCGDLNGDGKPELIVSRAGGTRNSIHILRNTSSATIGFAAQVGLFLDGGHVATRIAIRDLNKDGKPELIVTNSNNDNFYIFVNQSSGGTLTFNTTPVKLDIEPSGASSSPTYDVEVQDFNGDSWPDIVINRFVENNFYIFKNLGTGTISFDPPVMHPTAVKDVVLQRVSSADFNNDGKLDLIFTNSSLTDAKTSAIYLNQSTASTIAFASDATAIKLNTSAGSWGVDVGDMDGDKDVDFVVATKDVNELNLYTHNGNFASPGFTKSVIPLTTPIPWNARNIKLSDLDGDGKPEIAFTAQSDGTATTAIEILQNTHCHQPEIKNAEPLTICNGQSIVLKTIQANNVTYEWRKDPTGANTVVGTNSPFLTITTGGTYRVTATQGACSLSDEIVVAQDASTFPTDPVITANSPLCVASTLNLSSSDIPGGTYTWTKPNGSTLTGKNQSFTATLDDAGIYALQVNIGVCKSDIVTKRVDVASLGDFSISPSPSSGTVCQGSNVQLSVSNLTNHTYQWEKDGVDIIGSTASTLAATIEGSYTVRVTNTTLNCETETSAVPVIILQPPVADYTVDATACLGEALTFTNTSTTDPQGTAVYSWAFGDGGTSTEMNPAKTYSNAQNFNTSLTVNYSGVTGCSSNVSKQVNVVTPVIPTVISTEPALCPEEEATLSIAGTFTSISWSNAATGASITVTGPATYSVETVDANGCESGDDIALEAKPAPVLTVAAGRAQIPSGDTTQLGVTADPVVADITYAWLPAETLSNPSIFNPIASPTRTTTYTVTGITPDGCTTEAEIEIRVEGTLGFPAAFSPNNDGIADEWNIRAQDKPECTLSIFDSRGRRVFENKGANWDGTYQNKTVPAGAYYYVYDCPNTKPVTGSVLILR